MVSKCVDNDDDDGDDDDCVILDGDPDKHVTFENSGGDDSDDLCLVGEKGQVACRDYPHPRHLCVKFPFNSTPHERHCDQCHCYVCDSIAPCVHWGHGISSINHCHATDKDEYWKAQRKGAKTSRKALPFVSKVGSTPMNQVPSLPSNPLMCNQELSARQSGSIPSTRTPYGVMPVRTQEAVCNPSNKCQPYSVSRHLLRQNVGHAGTQFISQRVPFKKPGILGGTLTTNRYRNHSFRDNYGCQVSVNPMSRWQDTRERGNPMASACKYAKTNFGGVASNSMHNSSTCSSIGNQIGNYAPPQPQSQVYSQIHNRSVSATSAASCPQISSQTCTGGNLMPTVPGVTTQQWWESHLGNPLPSKPRATSQQNVCENVVPSQLSVNTHGNIDYPSENPVNFYGEPPTSQNSQSFPVECTQLQSSMQCENPANSTDLQWSLISDPHEVNSEFNTWGFEDLNFPLSPGYNLYSPESTPTDSGFLFDN